ncbi:DUF2663 family protein [Shouchella shacheensis]|uniref:DUF2663 family protein n=1 Tax=Shouchella shacheensis TaxID=1649580 RepID=UPI000740256C|nr:DUF2663 family protein [Shouchella shacheensis]
MKPPRPVASVLLEELVLRKAKLDKMERGRMYAGLSVLASAVLLLVLISRTITMRSLPLAELTATPLRIAVLLVLAGALARLTTLSKKAKKKENEYDDLRAEVIERSEELWYDDDDWAERASVFAAMKERHDINLYHK